MNNEIIEVDPNAASIQTHLGILQNVIQRMAANSSASKTWCVTLVSALLVIVADKGVPDYAYIALLPAVIFAALDAYYLALEKAFRNSYNDFISKLHNKTLTKTDLYSVAPKGNMSSLQLASLKSFSVWGFYLSLITLIFITKSIAIG
jgi:small basic protein